MSFDDASGENPMVVQFNSDIWVVEGLNATARQVLLRNARSDEVCSVCIDSVKAVDHHALIQSAVAKVAAKTVWRSLILVNGFTPEQIMDAQGRCTIIVRTLSGNFTVQEAANECDPSNF